MKLPIGFDHHELYTSTSASRSAATAACGITSALHHVDSAGKTEKNEDKTTATRRRTTTTTTTVRIAEDNNVVHDILPLSEYTPEEIRSCWFSRVEYNSFKRSSVITLNLNREGKLAIDDPDRTMRGLECRTRECTDSRRALRDSAMAAVMNEQFQQRRLDYRDPQAIADLYHSISWKSQYTAYTQGLADEQDAQETTFEERFLGLGGSNSQASSTTLTTTTCTSTATATTTATTTAKRNSVLSAIISIDTNDVDEEPLLDELEIATAAPSFAGFDCDLWTDNNATTTTTTCTDTTTSFINLNNFFNDMSLGTIAVGGAA